MRLAFDPIVRQAASTEGWGAGVDWLAAAGRYGAFLVALLFIALLVRAFLRRHRYRATDVLSEAELVALRAEITSAEKRTVGELLVVVLERSDRHPGASWLSAMITLIVGTTSLAPWLPWEAPVLVLLVQLGLAALGYVLAHALPDYQRLFLRESRATEMAEEQAFQEFYRQGLHATRDKTGVLLFVSLLEHRVVVLADEGITRKVGAEHWQATDAAILRGIVAGSLRDGLHAGIQDAGEVLAEHFPWKEGDANEVHDLVIVRHE